MQSKYFIKNINIMLKLRLTLVGQIIMGHSIDILDQPDYFIPLR